MQQTNTDSHVTPQASRAVFFISIWFALLASGLELAIRLTRKWAWNVKLQNNANIGWMTPLAYLLAMLVPAVIVYWLVRCRPRWLRAGLS